MHISRERHQSVIYNLLHHTNYKLWYEWSQLSHVHAEYAFCKWFIAIYSLTAIAWLLMSFLYHFELNWNVHQTTKKKEEIKRDKRNNSFPQAKCIRKNILFLDLIASYDDHCWCRWNKTKTESLMAINVYD